MTFSTDASPSVLDWKFSQVFGERSPGEEVQDVDIISTIEFDKSGDYLAVGDKGGRVVIFERKANKNVLRERYTPNELEQLNFVDRQHPEFQYKTEFQSHEPEFDYLKSLEIEERINKVRWCTTPNGSLLILSTNDKTIKLWKVKEQKVKKVKEMDTNSFVFTENVLLSERSFVGVQHHPSFNNGYFLEWTGKIANRSLPSHQGHIKAANIGDFACSRCRKVFAHAHDFNINSISNNSDGETFVSADDLRINLWNLEVSGQCFNIIDMKPSHMEDLTEVITSAEFHPFHCNLLAYSSSRGFIRLVDMRQSALCDHSARILRDEEPRGSKSLFTEIIASISDIKFSTDGRHILSRDYMNLKLWDMRMETSPVVSYKIHDHLLPKLCDLYNNDAIFDKFHCCLSGDGLHFATGSYSNLLCIFTHGVGNEEGVMMEVSKTPCRLIFCNSVRSFLIVDKDVDKADSDKVDRIRADLPRAKMTRTGVRRMSDNSRRPHLQPTPRARRSSLSNLARGFYRPGHEKSSLGSSEFSYDLSSKLLHLAWHPRGNVIACGAGNSLFLYYA